LKIKYTYISGVFIALIILNICSSTIIFPKHDHQFAQTTIIPPLLGTPENIVEKTSENQENTITASSGQNNDASSCFDCTTSFNPINAKIQSESTEDAVDNIISDVDSSADKGTHTNFINQQGGPDDIFDVLTEVNSPQQEQIDLKVSTWTNWQDNWAINGTSPYLDEADDGNNVYGIQNAKGSSDGDLTGEFEFEDTSITETINSVKLRVYGSAGNAHPSQYYFYVYLWDGNTWNQEINFKNVGSLTWVEVDVTSDLNTWSKINNAKIYLEVEDSLGNKHGGQICDASLLRISYNVDNYALDLEEQWTSANYTKENEELAIYTGTLGSSEDLRVDVWTGASWATIIDSLKANDWNNVSVSSYLTSNTFTIRFKGTTESDDFNQDSFNIDVVLLHTWMSNLPPSVTNITLSPDPLLSNDTLNLSYNYTDPNNDSESGTEIRWYRNGLLEGAFNNSMNIPSSALAKNDIWNVSIRPSDGTLSGDLSWSTPITVLNTPPTVSDYQVTPTDPVTNLNLIASYTFNDYDVDDENITFREIQWYNNTQIVPSLNNFLTVLAENTIKGEEWYFQIRVHDGENYSSWVTSSIVIINNTKPVASSLAIIPTFPETNNSLTANYSYADADSDSESNSIIYWYKNGVYNDTFDNQTIVPSTETKRGESWYFTVQPSDGTSYGDIKTSASVLIQNSAPISGNLTISPSFPYTSDNLVLSYDYFDLDGDEQDNSSRQIHWYKDGVLQGFLNNSLTVSNGNISKDEIWHCKLRVSDGMNYDSWVDLPVNVTIINSIPSITGIGVTPFPATSQNSLTLDYTYIDADFDSENDSIIIWYKNGVIQGLLNGSYTVDHSDTSKNDIWHVKVKPFDGTDYGDWFSLAENVTIRNTPPEALNVEILESSPVNNDSDLHASYSYSDYDSDGQVNGSREIYWYWYNGTDFELQPLLNYSMVVGHGNTTIGDIWYFTIRCSDGINLSSMEISPSVTIAATPNTPPEAKYLNITPSIVTTLHDLYINWTFYDVDPGDINQSGTIYNWYINGVYFPSYDSFQTLPSSATTKGDIIHVKVKPRDGKDFGVIVGVPVNITIGNTPPLASNLSINPGNPTTLNQLQLSYDWDDIDDDDDDTGTKIIWYMNGALQVSLNDSDTVPSNLTVKGQIWHCKVQPNDGTDLGDWISLASNITIGNSAPSVSDLDITPSSPQTNDMLTVSLLFNDPDNDSQLNSYITWYKNGWPVVSFTNSTFIPTANTSKGENWYFTIIPSDGENYGSIRTSPTITILNSAPTISDLVIAPYTAQTQDPLSVNYSFVDIDADTESGTEIVWYINGILQVNLNNSRTIASGYTVKGQIWHCKVLPSDGQEFGGWVSLSANVTILNTKPTVDSVQIHPFGEVYTTTSLIADFEASDTNGDPIIDIKIAWYRDSTEVPEVENSTSVSSSYTQKGENWTYQVTVFDGEDWSLLFSPSEGKIILNSKPIISNVRLMGGFTTLEGITISYDFIDPDGDNESLADSVINWRIFRPPSFIAGIPNIKSLDSSWIVAGDFIWVLITPSDGEDSGNLFDSSGYPEGLRSVGNSAPYIAGVPLILDQNGTENFVVNSSLNAQYTVSDPDSGESDAIYDIEIQNGLVIGAEYQWYRNDELLSFLIGPTVSSQHLSSGDTWILSIRPRDKYGDFGPWINSSTITIGNSRIAITDIWFTNLDDGSFLINETFSYITLSLNWTFFDPDGEGQIDYEVFWYLDNGSGQFVIHPEYENLTFIPTAYIQKGQIWHAIIRNTDGTQWSSYMNSTSIQIINSPPVISNIIYYFDETISDVTPSTRINEFYVETEDISISYDYFDYDNDPENLLIRWFVQHGNGTITEVIQYENDTVVPFEATSPGERWWASITTFDEMVAGMRENSSPILIVYNPIIGDFTSEPGETNDGEYKFTIELTNYNTSEIVSVKFQFPGNITNHGIPNGEGTWDCSINLTGHIGTEIPIMIIASMSVSGTLFQIKTNESFDNIQIEDLTAPRPYVTDRSSVIELDDIKQPTNITVYIPIIENNAEIEEVLLFYTVLNLSTNPIGKGVSIREVGPLIMKLHHYEQGLPVYSVSITDLKLETAITLRIRIQTKDSLNNTDPEAYVDDFIIGYSPDPQDFLGPLIAAVSGMLALFLAVSAGYFLHQRRKDKTSEEKKSIEEKLAFMTDTFTILVTSAAGVPIWNLSNILYKADESLTGTLSGLSVGIDAFLESFQEDFISQMSDISLSRDHPEAATSYRLSVIEQNKIQIMILGSVSYRIFVFLKEIPSSFLRNTFLKALKDLQQNLPLYDTGIINEALLGPNIRRILRRYLPIGLLEPFKIDLERLAYFDSLLQQNVEKPLLSRGAISVLKFLVVTSLTPPTTSSTKQALLKLYPQTIANYPRRHSGILLYSDVMKLISQVGGFALKDASDALWMGIDDRVKILIPF
jgi:hypothetical protein